MTIPRRKVFISFYHHDDERYKRALCKWNEIHNIFIDRSLKIDSIDDNLPEQTIRKIIRDRYLRDSTVTILLAGPNTAGRKHVDWELYSSMYDGPINKQSGILVINLPETGCLQNFAAHGAVEQKYIYPEVGNNWETISKLAEYKKIYPHLPERIFDNLVYPTANISVTSWIKIGQNPLYLQGLIHLTAKARANSSYDLRRRMRRANSSLPTDNPFEGLFRQAY